MVTVLGEDRCLFRKLGKMSSDQAIKNSISTPQEHGDMWILNRECTVGLPFFLLSWLDRVWMDCVTWYLGWVIPDEY